MIKLLLYERNYKLNHLNLHIYIPTYKLLKNRRQNTRQDKALLLRYIECKWFLAKQPTVARALALTNTACERSVSSLDTYTLTYICRSETSSKSTSLKCNYITFLYISAKLTLIIIIDNSISSPNNVSEQTHRVFTKAWQ